MDVTIPYWFIGLAVTFGGGFVTWMIFLTRMAFQANKDTALAAASDITILNKIDSIEKKMDSDKTDIKEKLSDIEASIQRLFGTELAFMRSLAIGQPGNKPV
jgi:hypothetical protein